jgi:hypothetical protein
MTPGADSPLPPAPAQVPQPPGPLQQALRNDLSKDLAKLLILGLPTLLIQGVFKLLADRFFTQPWQAVWIVGPLVAAAWMAWQAAKGRPEFRLRAPFVLFFIAYVSAFSIASATSLLDWSRHIVVFDKPVSRSWLAPVRAGDWRYAVMPPLATPRDMLVMYLDKPAPGTTLEQRRYEFISLIGVASAHRAKGVAFDVYLAGESLVDRVLCDAVRGAKIPVAFGRPFRADGTLGQPPESLRDCGIRWVHLGAIADHDGRIRSIPLFYGERDGTPALALESAAAMGTKRAAEIARPRNDILSLARWADDRPPRAFSYARLTESDLSELFEQFVVVGEDSRGPGPERDRFPTPFGELPGVEIHTAAIQSLRTGEFVERAPWPVGFGCILVVCYLLTALAARGASVRLLLVICGGASLLVVASSAAAASHARLWVDVVYPLTATWLLLPFALAMRRVKAVRPETTG